MTDAEQKEFLVNTLVSLLQRAMVYRALVDWLTIAGVDCGDIEQVLDSARKEIEKDKGLPGRLRNVVESALQSGEANYDLLLASCLSQWMPKGKPN